MLQRKQYLAYVNSKLKLIVCNKWKRPKAARRTGDTQYGIIPAAIAIRLAGVRKIYHVVPAFVAARCPRKIDAVEF